MPAYNFCKRFAPMVKARVKGQTIRPKRRVRPRVGQWAFCFYGMRTRQCQRLGAWPIICVTDIRIDEAGALLNGGALSAGMLDRFARDDGFKNWGDMLDYFRSEYGLPFHGDLIIWSWTKREGVE